MAGVMARSKDRWRGYPHPEIHVVERKPSKLRSSHSLRILEKQDLVVRMSCYAASDWFIEEEKGRVETRSIPFMGVVASRRFTEDTCFASAAAASASIAADRAWATFEDTGFAQSSVMVRRPRLSAEDATPTREGTTCLLARTTVTSGTRLLFSEELLLLIPNELEWCAPLE